LPALKLTAGRRCYELRVVTIQLEREGSPLPRLRLPRAKFSREPNQVARGRIRGFESDMPSQTVRQYALARARSCCLLGCPVPRKQIALPNVIAINGGVAKVVCARAVHTLEQSHGR